MKPYELALIAVTMAIAGCSPTASTVVVSGQWRTSTDGTLIDAGISDQSGVSLIVRCAPSANSQPIVAVYVDGGPEVPSKTLRGSPLKVSHDIFGARTVETWSSTGQSYQAISQSRKVVDGLMSAADFVTVEVDGRSATFSMSFAASTIGKALSACNKL